MTTPEIPYPHPGEVLKEEFMEPLGLTAYKVAKGLGVSATAVGELLAGKRAISVEMAFRLERYTKVSAQMWLNLQTGYDLEKGRKDSKLTRKLRSVHPLQKAA